VLPKGIFQGHKVSVMVATGYGANLPALQAAAGHFNPTTDEDGVTRRVPMLIEFEGAYYEPLSMAVLRLLLGAAEVKPGFTAAIGGSRGNPGLEWLDVGSVRIPVDREVNALIPYRGPKSSFPCVSATDVLSGAAQCTYREGKVVLVGTTAPGLVDLRSAPVGAVYPGVEVHASLISGMLDRRIKQAPAYVRGAEVALLALAGLVLTLVLPLLNPLKATAVTAVVLAAVVLSNVAVWESGNSVLPLASGVLMVALLFALNMCPYGFFVESRSKRQITGLFGQYAPPELVDEMSQNPERFSMEGDSRDMSVLFSDVCGFTTISEGMGRRSWPA
jgi:adenylate cyclase